MSTTNGKEDSAGQRALKGAQEGSAFGPYGAAGGFLDGLFGGPIYNMLNPDQVYSGLSDDMRHLLENINLNPPPPVPYLDWNPTTYDVDSTLRGKKTPVWLKNPDGSFKTNKDGDKIQAKNDDGTLKFTRNVTKGSKDIYGSPLNQIKYRSFTDWNRLQYDPQRSLQDLAAISGFSGTTSQQARAETLWNQGSREAVAPGSTESMGLAGQNILAWLNGEVAPDEVQSLQSAAASNFGGSYRPFSGRQQTAPSAMLKNLGLTSTQMRTQGVSAAQAFNALADQLITKPGQKTSEALALGNQRYAYDALATQTGLEESARTYQSRMTNNIIRHSPDPRAVGYLNDSIKLNSLNDQGALTSALNKQQTDLINSQMWQQYGMNQSQLDLAKFQALLGGIPGQMGYSNFGGNQLGAAALSAGAQLGSTFLSSYFANRGGGAGYGSSGVYGGNTPYTGDVGAYNGNPFATTSTSNYAGY